MEERKSKIKLSDAFKQRRKGKLDYSQPIKKVIQQAKSEKIPLKKVAQISQITANIHKGSKKTYDYHTKLAKVARSMAHSREPNDYSLKYPKSAVKEFVKEAKPIARQLRLKV